MLDGPSPKRDDRYTFARLRKSRASSVFTHPDTAAAIELAARKREGGRRKGM